MVLNYKSALTGKLVFQLFQVVSGKINYLAATGADQVVMVPGDTEGIAGATGSSMKLANKVKCGEDFKGTVYGHQADAGPVPVYYAVYFGGCQVVLTSGNSMNNDTTLWCHFVTVFSQGGDDGLFGNFHLS